MDWVRCASCRGPCHVDGAQAVCADCGFVGYLAEPGLSPRERYAARRRLDELQTDVPARAAHGMTRSSARAVQ